MSIQMRLSFIIIPFLAVLIQSAPLINNSSSKIIYGNAVDITLGTAVSTFNCYKSNNVQTVFVRVYTSSGQIDSNGPVNVQNAFNANMGIEIYMTPSPLGRSCSQQFDDTYNYLTNNGVTVRSIWLQVTQPITWPNSPQNNQIFIANCMQRAASRGLNFGIFTNSYDWMQITGGWSTWSQSYPNINLWYWSNSGNGPSGQSSKDFTDFVPFSGFFNPIVKQYAQSMSLCGTSINYDVYKISNHIKSSQSDTEVIDRTANNNKIVVGQLMDIAVAV